MSTTNLEYLPPFLRSYGSLISHLYSHFDGLKNTVEKGKTFADFVIKVIPLADYGSEFRDLKPSGKLSHDRGIDLVSNDGKGCVQCKLTIKSVEDIDRIISKFEAYHRHLNPPLQRSILDMINDEPGSVEEINISFMIVTLSDVKTEILPKYEKSQLSSVNFYRELKRKELIHVLHGPEILPILQSAYSKMHIKPSSVLIHLDSVPLRKGNVYVGIISSQELKQKYEEFGEALFLENVRGFLGTTSGKKKVSSTREYVNEAIRQTAKEQPERMLARNNGITFRTRKVQRVDDKTLLLDDASIVNGCQTTMCLVESSMSEDAFVCVKIVETDDSWDIAKAANFQNKVEQIELYLARYIRPQIVKEAGNKLGVRVSGTHTSIFDVFSSLSQDQVMYDEIYSLFVALFSRTPINAVNANFTEVNYDLLTDFSSDESRSDRTLEILFKLYNSAQEARKLAEGKYKDESYRKIFQSFWKEDKSDYRTVLTILAACGSVRNNIYSEDKQNSIENVDRFLFNVQTVLQNDHEKFIRYCIYAFQCLAMNYPRLGKTQDASGRAASKKVTFDELYSSLCVIADSNEP
jgi:hypothetical protein